MSSSDRAPRKFKGVKKVQKKGLIIVHTGDGKGKSTAAFGTAIRALGRGHKVAIVQFIKGKWKTGEEMFFKSLGDRCPIFPMGEGFTWETKNFARDKKTTLKAWEKCCDVLHDPQFQLVIFDEINYVLQYNFLDVDKVVKEIKSKPPLKHVILTGNGAPSKIIQLADLVTEMKCVKHPFHRGLPAQAGIEY